MERKVLPISVSPAFFNSIKGVSEGNVSGYFKKSAKFFMNFGLNTERLGKLKDAAEKENRTLDNLVTDILVAHLDKVRYFKSFQ